MNYVVLPDLMCELLLVLQEVTGCNSNDSVGGANSSSGGPGGVRPSPSPTGSASSRSMSPAVGMNYINKLKI